MAAAFLQAARKRWSRLVVGATTLGALAVAHGPGSPRRPPRSLLHEQEGCTNAWDALSWMPAWPGYATVDGRQRMWYVYEAAVPSGDDAVPLVIDLHGWTSCVVDVSYFSGWKQLADAEGFAVVWPAGLQDLEDAGEGLYNDDSGWNAGSCCGSPYFADVDDVAFVRAVVNETNATLGGRVDGRRVYASGHSNGASQHGTTGVLFLSKSRLEFTENRSRRSR